MSTRVQEILVRARDILADPNQERWTDSQLLRLVDDAQKFIVLQAKLLRSKITIPLINGQAEYDLPEEAHRYIRVLDSTNDALPLYSHEQADKLLGDSWETDTGPEVEAIIFDKTNTGKIKVYPIPEGIGGGDFELVAADAATWNPTQFNQYEGVMVDSGYTGDTFTSAFGVVVDLDYVSPFFTDAETCEGYTVTEDGNLNSPYGVLVNLEDSLFVFSAYDPIYGLAVSIEGYELSSLFGVTTDFPDDLANSWVNDLYGLLINFTDESDGLTVYYHKKPEDITSDTTELEIDSVFDRGIKHYVAGMALRANLDTQSVTFGERELSLFQVELQQAITDGTRDFQSVSTQYTTPYDRGI